MCCLALHLSRRHRFASGFRRPLLGQGEVRTGGVEQVNYKSMQVQPSSRIGPIAAIAGAVLLFVGTFLHPMSADPNVPLAAFREDASSGHWVAIHLTQLFGGVLIAVSLVL